MKTSKTLLLSVAIATTFSSCIIDKPCLNPSDKTITETQNVGNFSEIEINVAADVLLIQDSSLTENEISISGPSNLVKNLETKVRSGSLIIKDQRCVNSYKKLSIEIKFKSIDELTLNGSGDVSVLKTLDLPVFEVDLKGSGNINLDVNCKELDVLIDGSGNVYLSGITIDLEVDINGSGDVDAFDLHAQNADIEVNGSGKCKVWAEDSLNIKINGSGDVWYMGNANVNSSITGSGSIKNLN